MARLKKGLLGGISGRLGNIVGYTLNGQQIIRTRRITNTKPPTEKQLAVQHKFRIVNQFLGAFSEFIKAGFAYVSKGKTHNARNAAISWQLVNAITGEYPDLGINYAAVRVSSGSMDTQGINPVATIADHKVIFTWTPDLTFAHSNDNAMLLAYAPALNEAVYKVRGATRSAGTDELALSGNSWEEGIEVHIYLSFIVQNGNKCTNSMYLGSFQL